MLRWVHAVAALFLGIVLPACSSLSEEECLYLNWQVEGIRDGTQGAPASEIEKYQSMCDRYAIQVDREMYEKGRLEGVTKYCTRSNGFKVGINGRNYRNACPRQLASSFLSGYQPGSELHRVDNNVNAARRIVSSATSQISRNKQRIDEAWAQLEDADLTSEERRKIRQRIRELDHDIANARDKRIVAQLRIPELENTCLEVKERVEALGFAVRNVC